MNIEIEKLLLNLISDSHNVYIEVEHLIKECSAIDENFHLTNIFEFYEKRFSQTHYVRIGYLKKDPNKYYINVLDKNKKRGLYKIFADDKIGTILSTLSNLRKVNQEEKIPDQESKKKKNVLTESKTVEVALYMIKNNVKPDTKVCDVMVTKHNLENIIKIKMLIQDWINNEMKVNIANNFIHSEQPKKVDTPALVEQPKKKLSLFRRFVNFITLNGAKNVV